MLNQILESPIAVVTTNTVAVGAIASPIWLSYVSSTAAGLLPILGCAWLIVQIVHHFTKKEDK